MSTLRMFVDLRNQIQKARIQMSNRLSAIDRGADQAGQPQIEVISSWHKRLAELEMNVDEQILELVAEEPLYEYVAELKGVGPILAARLLSAIDFQKADTVSALWRYAGFAVKDGRAERPQKGVKLPYNRQLKTSVYLIAVSFLRANSPYREIYDQARRYYEANRPNWTKGHIHFASLRKMAKVFLQHLWVYGRTLHGLPVTRPYALDILKHSDYEPPERFGWRPPRSLNLPKTQEVEAQAGSFEEAEAKERSLA